MSASEFKEKGNKFLQAGQYDEAIKAYTEAINIEPKNHVFFSNRSAAYLSKGDAQSALADGQRCVDLDCNWPKGYTRKAAALHSLRKYDDAINTYNEGLKVAPTDAGLKNGLAEVQKAKDASQSSPPGGGMGGLFGPQMLAKLAGHPKFGPKLGDPNFMNKIQMMQSNPNMMLQDPEMMEVLQVILGGMRGDDANSPFSPMNEPPAPKKDPVPEPEPVLTEEEQVAKQSRDKSNSVKDKGNALYKAKNFEDAIKAYDEAYELDPTNFMVINNKAAVYIEMGECEKAREISKSIFTLASDKSIRLSYDDRAKIHQRIAGSYLKENDVKNAIAAYGDSQMEKYDKAVERKVKNLELELKKKAMQAYIDPELALEAKERGNTAFREGNYPVAITEYEEACKRDPQNPAYHNNLSAAYVKMGLFNDAKREVDKSLELDKNYVKAWAKKGDIEFFMKEYHKALDSYKAGLAIEPDNSLCKSGLSKTMIKIQEANTSGVQDKERAAHAMADPEIQQILSDPTIRQTLQDFQENPKFAQEAMMNDANIRSKIEKLIAAGVLQVK